MFQPSVTEVHNNHMEDEVEAGIVDKINFGPSEQLHLRFCDLSYKVTIKEKSNTWKSCLGIINSKANIVEKKILYEVNGSVEPGEMLALMGPSGSGKTSLLNLLSGRIRSNWTGKITYNELPYNKDLRKRIGFVPQNDVVLPHLTVKETLISTALLRLPRTLSKEEKIKKAHQVISDLSLERCQNTMVGGTFILGVSGGERKRVCIGIELLNDPSIMFFDEPISGLDSTIALRTIEIAKKLTQSGMAVVMSIHQPSKRLYDMFDSLLLLSEGHCIYYGHAQQAMNYFETYGFKPPLEMNAPEFFMDLCSGNVSGITIPRELDEKISNMNMKSNEELDEKISNMNMKSKAEEIRKYIKDAYKSISSSSKEKESSVEINSHRPAPPPPGASWVTQFLVLTTRGFKERRHEYLTIVRFLEIIILSFVAGMLWWKSSYDTDSHLGDQLGLLFFIGLIWGLFPLFQAIYIFPQERPIMVKERQNNMYSLSAYFMAKILADIPFDLVSPTIFIIILAPMANMRGSANIFFARLFTIFLIVLSSQGLGLFCGAILMDARKANSLATVVVTTFMLTGGIFVQNIPAFIGWLKYLSFQYHGFNLLLKIEYAPNMVYDCEGPDGCVPLEKAYSFSHVSLNGGKVEVVALLAMIVGYRILTYIILRFQKNPLLH